MANDPKALKSHLIVLMTHIIKWLIQPVRRTASWVRSIRNSRDQIAKIRARHPALNDKYINDIWDDSTDKAIKKAEEETGIKPTIKSLTWDEVFGKDYQLDDE